MPDNSPVFILSCARSGSTLTRLVLDAHPDIACPPELHLLVMAQKMLWAQGLLDADRAPEDDVWSVAIPSVRRAIDAMMSEYAHRHGKTIWAEKSVTSINHADVLSGVFPDARCVILYRHAADFLASALEAIADRPEGYDFDTFVAREPHRATALLQYWNDRTSRLLAIENDPAASIRLRYEDLVIDPDIQLRRLAAFVDVEMPDDWAARVFTEPHQTGPGDAKAYVSTHFDSNRIGRGDTVDLTGVPRTLVKQSNRLLQTLGYDRPL